VFALLLHITATGVQKKTNQTTGGQNKIDFGSKQMKRDKRESEPDKIYQLTKRKRAKNKTENLPCAYCSPLA